MFNIQNLMKQAQMMQKRMADAQEKLGNEEREGTAAGGAVKIVLSGHHDLKSIKISPDMVSKDDVELLEDAITAAYHDAHAKIVKMQDEGMKEATGGADFGGLKIPF